MSRREGRESESKRHRSKFDRDPSPKRSRRDGKPATERLSGNMPSEVGDRSDRDQKHSRQLRDALPLEAPPLPDAKIETVPKSKESERITSEQREGIKSSNLTDAQRSRSYFQHDDRGRRYDRRAPMERGWQRDSKDQLSVMPTERAETHRSEKKDEKNQSRRDDHHTWKHDGYYDMERDQGLPARKRPAFRERKAEPGVEPRNAEKLGTEPVRTSHFEKGAERKDEREEPQKPFGGEGEAHRRGLRRGSSFLERDRYSGSGNYRGRERFYGRRGSQQSGGGGRVEKWKHDLFEEANRSPTPKDEEDHIAKVEALLAS